MSNPEPSTPRYVPAMGEPDEGWCRAYLAHPAIQRYLALRDAEARADADAQIAVLRHELTTVINEFNYWAGPMRPAVDGGEVRVHRFTEVQPEMERVMANALRVLSDTSSAAHAYKERIEREAVERFKNELIQTGRTIMQLATVQRDVHDAQAYRSLLNSAQRDAKSEGVE